MQHLDYGQGLDKEHQQQQSVLDLPLNMVVERYKRKTDQVRAEKRAAGDVFAQWTDFSSVQAKADFGV